MVKFGVVWAFKTDTATTRLKAANTLFNPAFSVVNLLKILTARAGFNFFLKSKLGEFKIVSLVFKKIKLTPIKSGTSIRLY